MNIINKDFFFDTVRKPLFNGRLSASQVTGMEIILNKWQGSTYSDSRWLAYMFATVYHETGRTMQPIEEIGKGKGKDYGKMLKMGGGPGKRIPYRYPKEIYYGRGLVQLTWFENYELMSRLLKVDFLTAPDMALSPMYAVNILFEGMLKAASSFGDFTGRSLEQYFNDKTEDWEGARKIINGNDKAVMIAGYGKQFLNAIKYI